MIAMRWRLLFFDHPRVIRAVDAATRRSLVRGGAMIRTIARRSMRRRKGPASPGQPPHSHTGTLRRLLFYGYDPGRGTVVVGPLPLRGGRATVPPLHEFGGQAKTTRGRVVKHSGALGRDTRGRFASRRGTVYIPPGETLTYAPRPYMGPALAAARNYLPTLWHNSVKGA